MQEVDVGFLGNVGTGEQQQTRDGTISTVGADKVRLVSMDSSTIFAILGLLLTVLIERDTLAAYFKKKSDSRARGGP